MATKLQEQRLSIENLKQIDKLHKESVKNLKAEQEVLQKLLEIENNRTEKENLIIDLKKNSLASAKEELKYYEDQAKANVKLLKEHEEVLKKQQQGLDLSKEEHDLLEETLDFRKNEVERYPELIKKQKEKVKAVEKEYRAVTDLKKETNKLSDELLAIVGLDRKAFSKTFIGRMNDTRKAGLSISKQLGIMGKNFLQALHPANLFAQTMQSVIVATIKYIGVQDEAVSSFAKATGAGDQYNEMIRGIGMQNLALGIDTQDAASAILSLKDNFTDFTFASRETQTALATFTATAAEFGVSVDTTATIMQNLVKSSGYTIQEAMAAQHEIANVAESLGESQAKVAKQFADALPSLAKYGSGATAMFKKLETQSKQTGIEMNRLISITERFDTFEQAATSVGQLNAILGGPYIDSMRLTMATEEERLEMLRSSILAGAGSYEQMTRYQRLAIASAAGLSGPAELAQLLSGNLGQVAEKEADFANMAQKAQNVGQKLKALLYTLAIRMEPLVDRFKDGITSILEWVDANKGFTQGLISLGEGMMSVVGFIGQIIASVIKWLGEHKTLAMMIGIAIPIFIGLKAVLGGIGLSLPFVGAGAQSASTGIGSLGAAASAGAVGFLSFAAAVISVGGAIYLIGKGISALIDSITKLIDSISKLSAENLMNISKSIGAIGLALSDLPKIAALTFAGFMSVTATATETMAHADTGFAGIRETIQATNNLETSSVENVKMLVQQAKEYKEVQVEMQQPSMDSFIQAIKTAMGFNASANRGNISRLGERTIVLQLDGRVLDKHIINVMEDKLRFNSPS